MEDVYRKVQAVAQEDVTVLIIGESGTGKELTARAIHNCSCRSAKAFVPINMGALTSEITPSEFFGHEKGAFTGATDSKRGLFEAAENGTLFLDEIESMDHKAQTTLLRILENREYCRVGGSTTYHTNARIIAATISDLRTAVQEKRFRRDLLYRLEVFVIRIPALRERTEDIPTLVTHFIDMFRKEMKKNDVRDVSQEAMGCLLRYSWPGNVRELKNVIQSSMLLAGGDTITPDNLPPSICRASGQVERDRLDILPGLSLREVEMRYIVATLRCTGNNKSEAARRLGVSRRYLYNKINEYNKHRPTGT
jgi:DNA-binding NtrC family response regulator